MKIQDIRGMTALLDASARRHSEIVSVLLNTGDPNQEAVDTIICVVVQHHISIGFKHSLLLTITALRLLLSLKQTEYEQKRMRLNQW